VIDCRRSTVWWIWGWIVNLVLQGQKEGWAVRVQIAEVLLPWYGHGTGNNQHTHGQTFRIWWSIDSTCVGRECHLEFGSLVLDSITWVLFDKWFFLAGLKPSLSPCLPYFFAFGTISQLGNPHSDWYTCGLFREPQARPAVRSGNGLNLWCSQVVFTCCLLCW
jgi:hypothetical protein